MTRRGALSQFMPYGAPELQSVARPYLVRAARQWVFTPAFANHQPVAVWVAVPFNFGCGAQNVGGLPGGAKSLQRGG